MAKNKSDRMKTSLEKVSVAIEQVSRHLRGDDGGIDEEKLRQLKNLTSAAKELTTLIESTGDGEGGETEIKVSFTDGCEKWAK